MLILSLLVSIILLPIYLPSLLLFYIFKQIVHTILKIKYKLRLLLLESADTFWTVGKTHHNQSYILAILKDKTDGDIVAEVKNIIEEKLLKYADKYTKILCSLHTFLGYPYLLKELFEAENFLTILEIEKTSYGSIEDIIYDFGGKSLPLNGKLLWEIIIIKASNDWKLKAGLKLDQIPLILRENHTLTDGLSLMNLFANSFGDQIVDLSTCLKNIPRTPKSNILAHIFKNVFLFLLVPGYIAVHAIQTRSNQRLWKGPNIIYKQNIAYRCEKVGDELVQKIKSLKKEIGDTSFTEIIISSISASLNRHFLKNSTKVPDSVLLLVVATKDLKPMTVNEVPVLRNQFGMIIFELPIKVSSNSMLNRLEALKRQTRPMFKSCIPLVDSFILFNLMSLFPTFIIKWLFPMAETVGISNLPGFPKINICNGYGVEDVYFFLPQRDTNGIGFSVLTYDNRLHIGLTADEASIPSKAHCEDILKDFFKNVEDFRIEVATKKIDGKVIDIE